MAEAQKAQYSEQDLSEGKLVDQEQPQYVNTPPSRQAGANQPLHLNQKHTDKEKQPAKE